MNSVVKKSALIRVIRGEKNPSKKAKSQKPKDNSQINPLQFWNLIPILYICAMIQRTAEHELRQLAEQFKAVALIGPRQSGKTTLTRSVFSDKPYVSLENPDQRRFALEDPRGFLSQYSGGAIFDEIQRAPELLSYLQQLLDETQEPGKFILTGSNNILMQDHIVQSLAGRVAYLTLLPFSGEELKERQASDVTTMMYKGFYPPIYDQPVTPQRWYANYIRTYVERDVRQIKNIMDLYAFERFIQLCAGRIGQLLNMNSLAVEAGIDNKTVQSWLGVLENSYVLFRLQPYHNSFNKRLVKMPKLYFYDTGLACSLLGIQDPSQLQNHPIRGSLFENMVVLEILKHLSNHGINNKLYFWRNHTGWEIDLLIDTAGGPIPIEIKSGQTLQSDLFKNLLYWQQLSQQKLGCLVYGGQETQTRSSGITVLPWSRSTEVFSLMRNEK